MHKMLFIWAQNVVFMSTKCCLYEHKMLFMSTRWAQDDAHRCCLRAQDEYRWAQDDAHTCCLLPQDDAQDEHKMLFMNTRCYLWTQKSQKHKNTKSTKREISDFLSLRCFLWA